MLCSFGFFFVLLIHCQHAFVDALPKQVVSKILNQQSRRLGFEELDEICQNVVTSIEKGPSEVLRNITDSSHYDLKKRPNTAPVNRGTFAGREATTAPDNVTYSMFLSSVEKVSLYNEEITLSVYELLWWHDPRLAFDLSSEATCVVGGGSSAYPAISLRDIEIEGELQVLWKPDLYLVNSRAKIVNGGRIAYIFDDGHVLQFQQRTMTSSCPMDFGSFPYTSIQCDLDISTFSQSSDELNLNYNTIPDFVPSHHIIDLNTFVTNYQIGAFKLDPNPKSKSYIDETTSKQHLIATITLIHQSGSFWEAVLIPDFLLHLAIFSSFWISSTAAPARVTICVIAALTCRVLMSSLYDQLPAVSYDLWIIDYMVASQIIALVALAQYALVQYYLNTEDSRNYVLISLQESHVLEILDSGKMTTSELLELAVEKYNSFHLISNKVLKQSKKKHQKQFYFSITNIKKYFQKFHKNTKINPMSKTVPYDFAINRIKDRGSSINRITAESESYFDGKIGITDVMNIITVKNVFNQFDENDEGIITISELQNALRYFGCFYSHLQICALMENFWQAHGTLLEYHIEIDIETFLRVLIGHKIFEPFKDLNKNILEQKPSIICDVFARIVYPIICFTKCFIFWCILSRYENNL